MLDPKSFKEYDNHKKIIEINDSKNNLYGFIAIHNSNLGPATGGTRMFPYSSKDEALKDVLNLSRAMSYKCALAGVNYGGGKGVIIGDPKKDKTDNLLSAYAQEINKLNGDFRTGEDVGISEEDVQKMLKVSPYFIGKSDLAGDPSPYAALSTFIAIKEAIFLVLGLESLDSVSVAIKGVGKVGASLVKLLSKENAKITISDVDKNALSKIEKEVPKLEIVSSEEIHKLEVDVYAPCAMGNEFTQGNYKDIKAKIICGSANNQLSDSSIGYYFFEEKIIYVPDYIANAGGLINVVDELEKDGYQKSRVEERILNIKKTIENVYKLSKEKNMPMNIVADELAERKLKNG